MATLEERIEALERALAILQQEHVSDIRQLDERIIALQQQLAEQRRRLSEQGQTIHQRFDRLEMALSQQFGAINRGFEQMDKNFDEIRQKFDTSDHFAARTWGVVHEQQRDIRERLAQFDQLEQRFDGPETRMEARFAAQDEKLNQILARLPELGQ